jgi:hypothetical protein
MNRRLNLEAHLQSTLNHNGSRRAFAARLDMTIKRAKVTSGRVARSLGVPEHEVTLWRAGVTAPKSADCERLQKVVLYAGRAVMCLGQATGASIISAIPEAAASPEEVCYCDSTASRRASATSSGCW